MINLPAWVEPYQLDSEQFSVWRRVEGQFVQHVFRCNENGLWLQVQVEHGRAGATEFTNASAAPIDVWAEAVAEAQRRAGERPCNKAP